MRVFTYWEGELPFVNKICLKSITNIYGNDHIHITPNNLQKYIKLPDFIKNHKSIVWKSDYIRGMLLYEYGGLWLDCDIILNRKIFINKHINKPKIWKEGGFPIKDFSIYKNLPALCIGTIYSPKRHSWLHEIFRRLEQQTNYFKKYSCLQKWVSGQRVYRDVIYEQGLMEIGSESDFNLIYDATHWYQYWDGSIHYSNKPIGIHLLLGSHNNLYQYPKTEIYEYPNRIKNLKCKSDVYREFPNSILAEYLNQAKGKKGSGLEI